MCRVGITRSFPSQIQAIYLTAYLGCVGMCHSDDDISLFVSCVDVPVSLDIVFNGIASIDDLLYLPRLNQLFEEIEVFSGFARCPCCIGYDCLAASPQNPSPSNHL